MVRMIISRVNHSHKVSHQSDEVKFSCALIGPKINGLNQIDNLVTHINFEANRTNVTGAGVLTCKKARVIFQFFTDSESAESKLSNDVPHLVI